MLTDKDYVFIKCIDNEGSCNLLEKGRIYSFIPPSDNYMYFIEELGSFWSCDRFEVLFNQFGNIDLYKLCGLNR